MQAESSKGFSILAASLILSACGGGGGESATPLSSWTPTSTVIANGQGQEGSYTYDPATKKISNIIVSPGVANYSTQLTLDAGALTGLTLTTPTKNLSFASYEISNLTPAIWGATNGTSNVLLANPFYQGWDYQNFGVWETGLDTTIGTFGAFSVGAPTAGPDIPVTGNPTFTGKVAGSYVSGELGHAVLADLTVNVDFVNRSLGFSTSNTQVYKPNSWTDLDPTAPDLNLIGTLNLATDGTNSFTGTLTTQSGLSGSSTGQFYGPTAQELGGVFFLPGNGETYTGAYGAKQTTAP